MLDKRIVIFDLDGTAVDSPKQKLPSERLAKAAKNLTKSHLLSAATGRPWAWASPVLHKLGLTWPCIISSGTQICNPQTGEILWQSDIDQNTLQGITSIVKNYTALHKVSQCRVQLNDFSEHDHFNGGYSTQTLMINEPTFLMVIGFVPETLARGLLQRLATIENISCTLVVGQAPGCMDIHITAKDASKEHAAIRLLQMADLETETAIGIGDGHNDLHLFRAVGHKVAMGNAVAELKRKADQVIGHVQDDGLAVFFEQLVAGYNLNPPAPNRSRAVQSTLL